MADYRRMGHVEEHLGNATSTSLVHQLRDLWRSPRGTVLRIEALAMVAIAISFFLAAFGSCRRWSNGFILQKGFLAANALFLSLGTYSIGLMQSSSVKSEMYPIWAVSLLALLCCVDSVTTYSLDSNSQFWKMIYQLCLYVGYVMLMSISTISSDVGNIAIGVLSAITFTKGFHRTLALVLPGKMRSVIRAVPDHWQQKIGAGSAKSVALGILVVDFSLHNVEQRSIAEEAMKSDHGDITLLEIYSRPEDNDLGLHVDAFKDVCFSFSLSHLLQRRFLGFNRVLEIRTHDDSLVSSWILLKRDDGVVDYERAFKVVELELAFLYDVLFTSNAFLHYYEAKTASVWALASIFGICFVGVAVVIPETRTTHIPGGTIVVDTTTGDLIITGVILVSLALLQVSQLLHCWTSNWARVSFACDCVRNQRKGIQQISWQMRLRASLSKINWFHKYLWQNSLGQHSLVESISTRECKLSRKFKACLSQAYFRFSGTLGLQYFEQVLKELWGNSTGDAIELHADVKASIADYISGSRIYNVSLLDVRRCLGVTYELNPEEEGGTADKYVRHLLTWHIATCYCELAQQRDKGFLNEQRTNGERATNYRVATALSKYFVYLVVSAPRLLPGPYMEYKYVYDEVAGRVGEVLRGVEDKLGSMERAVQMGLLGRVKYRLCEIRMLIMSDRETLCEAMDYMVRCEGHPREFSKRVWLRDTDWKWFQSWYLMKVDLGAMESNNGAGVMGMEEEREVLMQNLLELDAMEIDWRERWLVLRQVLDPTSPLGETLTGVKEKLAALERESERITEALSRAIDKLDLYLGKEIERRGIHRYDPDAGLGSRIFWSGMYLGGRLRSHLEPEPWKKLADLWVKALLYAAPSDNVEEHLQHLSRGGEFITHLWALLYHHGILRPEEASGTRIYAGEDGSSS